MEGILMTLSMDVGFGLMLRVPVSAGCHNLRGDVPLYLEGWEVESSWSTSWYLGAQSLEVQQAVQSQHPSEANQECHE